MTGVYIVFALVLILGAISIVWIEEINKSINYDIKIYDEQENLIKTPFPSHEKSRICYSFTGRNIIYIKEITENGETIKYFYKIPDGYTAKVLKD